MYGHLVYMLPELAIVMRANMSRRLQWIFTCVFWTLGGHHMISVETHYVFSYVVYFRRSTLPSVACNSFPLGNSATITRASIDISNKLGKFQF